MDHAMATHMSSLPFHLDGIKANFFLQCPAFSKSKAGAVAWHMERVSDPGPSNAGLKGRGKASIALTSCLPTLTVPAHLDVGASALSASVPPLLSGHSLFHPLPTSLRFKQKDDPTLMLPQPEVSLVPHMQPQEAASSSSQILTAPNMLPECFDVVPSHPMGSASSCMGSEIPQISPFDLGDWKWLVTKFESIVPVENCSKIVYSNNNNTAKLQPYSWDFNSQSLVCASVREMNEEQEVSI